MNYLIINNMVCDGGNNLNSIPEPAHGGFSISIQDVDSASTGRGADGKMIRDRVAVKRKINLKFPPMTQANIKKLLDAVSPVSFTVSYPDPMSTTGRSSGDFYVGDRTMPIYKMGTDSNVELWENVSFNLIEM